MTESHFMTSPPEPEPARIRESRTGEEFLGFVCQAAGVLGAVYLLFRHADLLEPLLGTPGEARSSSAASRWGFIGVALVCALVGRIVGARIARPLSRFLPLTHAEQQRTKHPSEPWLWDEEWAGGTMTHSDGRGVVTLGVLTVFTNLMTLPVGFEALRGQLPLLTILFTLVGLGLIALTVKVARSYFAYGRSRLELETLPGLIGGQFRGLVIVGAEAGDEVKVSLSCREERRHSRSTETREIWEEGQTVRPRSRNGGLDIEIPCVFGIPPDLPESSRRDTVIFEWRVIWTLSVSGTGKRENYGAGYDVPVFRANSRGPIAAAPTGAPVDGE